MTIVTALVAFLCFSKMFGDKKIGIAGSLMYICCPYRLHDLYIQGNWKESLAWSFVPIIIWGLMKLYQNAKESEKKNSAWLILTVGFGLLAACSPTFFFLAMGSALLTFVMMGKRSLNKSVLVCVGKTVIATALVSAWTLVPFLLTMRDASVVGAMIPENFRMEGMYLIQYLTFFSIEKNGLGILAVVLVFVYLWSLFVGKIPKDDSVRVLGIAGILMLLSSNLFPWDLLQNKNMLFSILLAIMQSPAKWGVMACGGLIWVACYMLQNLPWSEMLFKMDAIKVDSLKRSFLARFWLPVLALWVSLPMFVDYLVVGEELFQHLEWISVFAGRFGMKSATMYRLYIIFINLVTALVAHLSFFKGLKSRELGLLGAVIYVMLPTRILLLYKLADMEIYTIMAVLPLAVWVLCRICSGLMKGREKLLAPMFVAIVALATGIGCMEQNKATMMVTMLICVLFGIGCYFQSKEYGSNGKMTLLSAGVIALVYGNYLLNDILMNGWEIFR